MWGQRIEWGIVQVTFVCTSGITLLVQKLKELDPDQYFMVRGGEGRGARVRDDTVIKLCTLSHPLGIRDQEF